MDKTVTEHEYEVYMPIRLPYELVRLVREKNEKVELRLIIYDTV